MRRRNLRIPRPFVEGVIGAIGEVAQISVLYPLETIKVKCQADGLSTAAVLQQIMAQGKPLPILKVTACCSTVLLLKLTSNRLLRYIATLVCLQRCFGRVAPVEYVFAGDDAHVKCAITAHVC